MQTVIANTHGSHAKSIFDKSYLRTSREFVVAWSSISTPNVIYQRRYSAAKPQEAMIRLLKDEISVELFMVKDCYYMDEVVATAYELGYFISVLAL